MVNLSINFTYMALGLSFDLVLLAAKYFVINYYIYQKKIIIHLSYVLNFSNFCSLYRGYTRPSKPVPGDCGYYLHAHRLFLSHPITNEVLKRTYHYDKSNIT